MSVGQVENVGSPMSEMPLNGTVGNWRWSSRRCGPCVVVASDFDIVDSDSHFQVPLCLPEPGHHICAVTGKFVVEIMVDVVCCTQAEWHSAPCWKNHRDDLVAGGWLLVPPLFSPVKKVNFGVTRSACGGGEAVTVEIWTRRSARPQTMLRTAALTILSGLVARDEAPDAFGNTVDSHALEANAAGSSTLSVALSENQLELLHPQEKKEKGWDALVTSGLGRDAPPVDTEAYFGTALRSIDKEVQRREGRGGPGDGLPG